MFACVSFCVNSAIVLGSVSSPDSLLTFGYIGDSNLQASMTINCFPVPTYDRKSLIIQNGYKVATIRSETDLDKRRLGYAGEAHVLAV